MAADTSTVSVVLSVVSLLASTLGIFITHSLTQSRERQKQNEDNRKQEARELLTALYALLAAFIPHARLSSSFYERYKSRTEVDAKRAAYVSATETFHRVLDDRLYLAEEIKLLDIRRRLHLAQDAFRDNIGEEEKLKAKVDAIRDDVVAMALKTEPSLREQFKKYADENGGL